MAKREQVFRAAGCPGCSFCSISKLNSFFQSRQEYFMKRREFLAGGAIASAALAASGTGLTTTTVAAESVPVPGDQRAQAKFRMSSQLGIIPGNNDTEKLDWMKKNGF
ncbi:MAG TPA: hypothetical protein DEB39_09880, partial [Planctomycetaceae bacterium]|nr:hypothetical protein [Planctomycetaceae bacterium]